MNRQYLLLVLGTYFQSMHTWIGSVLEYTFTVNENIRSKNPSACGSTCSIACFTGNFPECTHHYHTIPGTLCRKSSALLTLLSWSNRLEKTNTNVYSLLLGEFHEELKGNIKLSITSTVQRMGQLLCGLLADLAI